jgi:CelD/BcsL family acetyltransferase involved in cellulose biosynthesis
VQLFHGRFRAFHRDFATLCAQRDTLRMSALNFDGSPISILYNVRIGAVEYNIQSGFSALTRSGTSPAYLHFGFCMEQASQEGVRHFDFLAGGGRKRDYKRDFNTRRTDLVTFQSIRTPALAWLYRQYDRIRARS